MKKTVIFLMICIMFISCGKKEVKPVSQESKMTQEAFVLAETIKEAFLKNDRTTQEKNSTAEGLKDITANKKIYDSVEISFTPRWVELEDNKMLVNISWKSAWTLSGRRTDGRGMAVFVMEGRPLKVSRILRANPFVFPEQ